MNSEYLSLSLPRAQPSILCLVSPSFSRTDDVAGQAVAEHRSRIKGIFPCLFPEASVPLFMAGTRGLCNCEQVDRVKHKCSLQKKHGERTKHYSQSWPCLFGSGASNMIGKKYFLYV